MQGNGNCGFQILCKNLRRSNQARRNLLCRRTALLLFLLTSRHSSLWLLQLDLLRLLAWEPGGFASDSDGIHTDAYDGDSDEGVSDKDGNPAYASRLEKGDYATCCKAPDYEQWLEVMIKDWLIVAFITWNSNLVPLLEGLCSSNPCKFDFSGFGVFAGIEPTTSGLTIPRSDQLS